MVIGCIFDLDGVLVDTEPLHVEAWREFFKRRNLELSDADVAGIHGVRGHDIVRKFMPEVSLEEVHALRNEKAAIFDQKIACGVPLVSGAVEFLQSLKEQGIPVAVGTSAKRDRALFQLETTGLSEYVDVVVTAEDVIHGKPDPEVYLIAAERLGIRPDACVVFEDAFSGVEAGVRAGMRVVGMLTSHTKEDFAHFPLVDSLQNFSGIDARYVLAYAQS